jgi:hypothetical protein
MQTKRPHWGAYRQLIWATIFVGAMSKKSALRKELLLMRIRAANSRFYLTEM